MPSGNSAATACDGVTDEKKSPVDAAIELFVFAPLGLMMTARENLPDLIAKGRQQMTGQVAMAKMMGQYAVKEGEKDLRKRVEGVAETLSALGVLPEPNPTPTTPPAPAKSAPVATSAPSSNGTAAKPATKPSTTHQSSDLSIPGYDTLSASQVVQRLAGLTVDELEAVRDYEAGTRGRRTILSKIAQLESGSA